MAVAEQTSTVLIGVFPARDRAEAFVSALHEAGFGKDQVGLLTPGVEGSTTPAEESAVAGALTGGAVGALTGAAVVAAVSRSPSGRLTDGFPRRMR